MFESRCGPQAESASMAYLRPETAQGSVLNFGSVHRAMREHLPFGIGQCGRVFRNELRPDKFLFRQREFEQMELEYFCAPGDAHRLFEYWRDACLQWLVDTVGLDAGNVRLREHEGAELAHYSRATCDIEYRYSFGWRELWGVSHRGDHDLAQHAAAANIDMRYRDPHTDESFLPHIVEPALGLDRLVYALLGDAMRIDEANKRNVFAVPPALAPYRFAVLPLTGNNEQLGELARSVHAQLGARTDLSMHHSAALDTRGSIGRRYRRQDEIGTPHCVTVDFDTLDDRSVTVRNRDSMQQQRVPIDELLQLTRTQFDAL
jgi:glycyl-tRNA synthetase